MKFERMLPTFPASVTVSDLREGTICFRLGYADPDLLVPSLAPVVFVGRDLEPEDDGILYFQDYESYQKGIRWNSPTSGPATFESFEAAGRTNMFHFADAVDELLRCLLRRREATRQHAGDPRGG